MTNPIFQTDHDEIQRKVVMHESDILASRYTLLRELPEHGFKKRYIATDGERKVLIESLDFTAIDTWNSVDLFLRGAKIMRNIDIDGVPRVLDVIDRSTESSPFLCVISEYREMKSLGELIADEKRFSHKECEKIIVEVLRILEQLRQLLPPVVHRNVTPDSICIDNDQKIWLRNFENASSGYDVVNDPENADGYYAPEHLRGEAEPASDCFSLGATVLALLSHEKVHTLLPPDSAPDDVAFRASVYQIVERYASYAHPEFKQILTSLLDPTPSQRLVRSSNLRNKKKQNALATDLPLRDIKYSGQVGSLKHFSRLKDTSPRPIPIEYQSKWDEVTRGGRIIAIVIASVITPSCSFVGLTGLIAMENHILIGLALTVFCSACAYLPIGWLRKLEARKLKDPRYRLLKFGKKIKVSLGHKTPNGYIYGFNTPNNEHCQGFLTFPPDAPIPPEIGILYNEKNPSDHIVYPFPPDDILNFPHI